MGLTRQHLLPPELELLFTFMVGVFWILTYVMIIYRGFIDKRCGMPFAALCGNVTWEYIYSILFPHAPPANYIIYLWLGLDIIILYQFILYSRDDLPKPLADQWFLPTIVSAFLIAFSLHYFIAIEFANRDGGYSAYGLNLLMSILFVFMLLRRDDLRGQSMYIAVFKLIGTIFASIVSYSFYPNSSLLTFLYVATFFFDILYVIMLQQRIKREAIYAHPSS